LLNGYCFACQALFKGLENRHHARGNAEGDGVVIRSGVWFMMNQTNLAEA
jgi:hypothetical protein